MTTHSNHNVKVFPTTDELNKRAAEFFVEIGKRSIAERNRFAISLSGGQTPQKLYSLLSESPFREQVQWEKTFIFWGDERCVPSDDMRNNAHQVKLNFLDRINIPESNIFPIPVNFSPEEAAIKYEKVINEFFGKDPLRFDLILLGLGENGHTASLFPGTPVLNEQSEGLRAIYVAEENMYRITMTAPLLNHARNILILVTGESKANILKNVFEHPYRPDKIPAQLIHPANGELFWFVDQTAAALL